MRALTANYLDDEPRPGTLVNRGFWIHDTPRLIPVCRLLGHKPVVDGTAPTRPGNLGSRWVCCDRCGVRPTPQGALDPERWNLGDPYTGPWGPALPETGPARREALQALKGENHPPGPWPTKPTGDLGGQLVLGRTFGGVGVELAIGCAGDEHTLSASLRLHHLGALYLHTQSHGAWLQRRLNSRGYDTRVIEFAFAHNGFRWRLWAKQGEWSARTPRWRDGSICLDPRELIWGVTRNKFDHMGEPEPAVVRMPHGDDYQVSLLLQRCSTGRPRSKRQKQSWFVDWDCQDGIPYREEDGWKGGSIYGSGVEVSDRSVEDGTWIHEATAAIAAQVTRHRTRYSYSEAAETA